MNDSFLGSVARMIQAAALSRGLLLPALAGIGLLAGCAGSLGSVEGVGGVGAEDIAGRVRGGQQPVAGALVQLLEPGTAGYGSAPTLIVAASAVTDGNGAFRLPRPYGCPANSGLVYLLATGGNAGGGVNPAIAEAAIVGDCGSLSAASFFAITEVTTVAAAYALAPFATVATSVGAPTGQTVNVGTSAGNLQGLYNAAGPAGNLANTASGTAHAAGDVAGVVPPTAEMNTLADILAACVNQGAPGGGSGACATLFAATRPAGGLTPTDTFQAAVEIAQHPGANVGTLFGLVPSAPPFQPTLSSVPNDFSVALGYTGGALTATYSDDFVAIDALGNAWIGDSGDNDNPNVHQLTEIEPTGVYPGGVATSPSGGFGNSVLSSPAGLAFDSTGYLWVADSVSSNILTFSPAGAPYATYYRGSGGGSLSLAFDPAGNAWLTDGSGQGNGSPGQPYSAFVYELSASGNPAKSGPLVTGGGSFGIAVSQTAVWLPSYNANVISRVDLATNIVSSTPISASLGGVAIDHSNNAWVAGINGNIFKIADSGALSGTFPTPGVLPSGIAVDGAGNIFVSNQNVINASGAVPGTVMELSNAGAVLSPGLGFTGASLIPSSPEFETGLAIDGSGDVWVSGISSGAPLFVCEVIGIAAPVVTPLSVATAKNQVGVRP